MTVSPFSLMMAIVWFSAMVIIVSILIKRNQLLHKLGISTIIVFFVLSVFRLFAVVEPANILLIEISGAFAVLTKALDSWLGLLLLLLWIGRTTFLILRFWLEYHRFCKQMMTYETIVEEEILAVLQDAASYVGVKAKVQLFKSSQVQTPMVFGFIRPMIVLPDIAIPSADLWRVLAHELTHFASKDIWFKTAVHLIQCLFWWNPLVYLLGKNIDHTLEMKCDLKVVSTMSYDERLDYFETIISFFKLAKVLQSKNSQPYVAAFVSARNKTKLKQRFAVGIDYKHKKSTKKLLPVIISYVLMGMLFIFSYSFVIQPAGQPDEECFTIDEDNAYLVDNGDGTYFLYIDNENFGLIKNDMDCEPFSAMPIKEKTNNEP